MSKKWWVYGGIGCLAVIIIAIIGIAGCSYFGYKTLSNMSNEVNQDIFGSNAPQGDFTIPLPNEDAPGVMIFDAKNSIITVAIKSPNGASNQEALTFYKSFVEDDDVPDAYKQVMFKKGEVRTKNGDITVPVVFLNGVPDELKQQQGLESVNFSMVTHLFQKDGSTVTLAISSGNANANEDQLTVDFQKKLVDILDTTKLGENLVDPLATAPAS